MHIPQKIETFLFHQIIPLLSFTASPTESVETAKDDTTAKVNLADSQDMSAKKIKYALANNKTNYTKGQVEVLMQFFQQTPYPDSEMLENIGKRIGVAERNVKVHLMKIALFPWLFT